MTGHYKNKWFVVRRTPQNFIQKSHRTTLNTQPSTLKPHCSSHESPSVIIFTSLPPFSGLTKMVRVASPRLRFRIEELELTMSTPSLLHPCAFRSEASSAQTRFTSDLLLNCNCSTSRLY